MDGTWDKFARYVITRPHRAAGRPVADEVRGVPGVRVLDGRDPSTALVEMSDVGRECVEREHPELAIEENLAYRLR